MRIRGAAVGTLDPSPAAPVSPPTEAGASRWAALPVLMAGTFLIVLDFFVINVALPSIQADLHASTAAIEWIIVGYGLSFAVLLITSGRIGDHIGRRRTFSIGLVLFALASAACGLAPTATVLVVARVLQGVAAALISPNVLSIIGVVYTGADRARAISVYGIVMGVAAAGGQLVGGLLIHADIAGLGWRTIFLINLPIVAAALAVAPRLVPESRAEQATRIDGTGIALLTAVLLAVLVPLVQGPAHGWPTWTWLTLASASALLAALTAHQRRRGRRGREPLLDPVLFTDPTFRVALLVQLTYWCSQAPFYLVLALYLQQGRGLDPLNAGLVFTILAAAYLATSLRAPTLTLRYGRALVAMGALTLAAGFLALLAAVAALGTSSPIAVLAPGLLLIGVGMGLCITPLTMIVLAHTDPQRAGAVSGALNTTMQTGNTLGVAVTGILFYGTLADGYTHAFTLALAELAALAVAVAALTRLLPPQYRPTAPAPPPTASPAPPPRART